MRTVKRIQASLGRNQQTFSAYATVLSVGTIRSDVGYVVPTVAVYVETFVDEPGVNRPTTIEIAVIRTGEKWPDGFEYVGTVPDNWDEVHVLWRRKP